MKTESNQLVENRIHSIPVKLIRTVESLIDRDGKIVGAMEAEKIFALMKDPSKLVSKSTYMNVLKAANDENDEGVLVKFLEYGGWDHMNQWLKEAKDEDNAPFLFDLLNVYKHMPVTVDLLKRNSCAKSIKQLVKKCDDEELKTLASEVVDGWMVIITGSKEGGDKQKKKHSKKSKQSENGSNGLHSGDRSDHGYSSKPENYSSLNQSASSDLKTYGDNLTKSRPKTVRTMPTKFRSTGNCIFATKYLIESEEGVMHIQNKIKMVITCLPNEPHYMASVNDGSSNLSGHCFVVTKAACLA